MLAVLGQAQLIDLLVHKGAAVNATDYHALTPLHLACQRGYQGVSVSSHTHLHTSTCHRLNKVFETTLKDVAPYWCEVAVVLSADALPVWGSQHQMTTGTTQASPLHSFFISLFSPWCYVLTLQSLHTVCPLCLLL